MDAFLVLMFFAALAWMIFQIGREAKRALGSPKKKIPSRNVYEIQCESDPSFPIRGTSHYQQALKKIAGRRLPKGVYKPAVAYIKYENDNPYDNQAVAVYLCGSKMLTKVGYFSRGTARKYREGLQRAGKEGANVRCLAVVVGGSTGEVYGEPGLFGVRLGITGALEYIGDLLVPPADSA